MKAARDYHADLIRHLKNPKAAVGYLNAALDEDDPKVFLLALRNVVEARGNMTRFAKKCEISRANVYKMTSQKGNPSIASVLKLMRCLGFDFKVEKSGKGPGFHFRPGQA